MIRSSDKADIQDFWKSLYSSLYDSVDKNLDRRSLFTAIEDLEDMFRYRGHGAIVEMPLSQLAGKRVLEIGSGAGGHSALFARHGAIMTSVDLTIERVKSTGFKFQLMGDEAEGCEVLSPSLLQRYGSVLRSAADGSPDAFISRERSYGG